MPVHCHRRDCVKCCWFSWPPRHDLTCLFCLTYRNVDDYLHQACLMKCFGCIAGCIHGHAHFVSAICMVIVLFVPVGIPYLCSFTFRGAASRFRLGPAFGSVLLGSSSSFSPSLEIPCCHVPSPPMPLFCPAPSRSLFPSAVPSSVLILCHSLRSSSSVPALHLVPHSYPVPHLSTPLPFPPIPVLF